MSLAVLSAGSALLAGCNAVGAPSTEPTERSASLLWTNVCFTNESSHVITVDFTLYDTKSGERELGWGQKVCAAGSHSGADVIGLINKGTPDEFQFEASNRWAGAPYLAIWGTESSDHHRLGMCSKTFYNGQAGWDVNESQGMAFPTIVIVARRLPDDGFKQFDATVRSGNGSSRHGYCDYAGGMVN
jgi:hypothetical protein